MIDSLVFGINHFLFLKLTAALIRSLFLQYR